MITGNLTFASATKKTARFATHFFFLAYFFLTGSCWSFAIVAAFESQISIKNNTNLDLSEQILVDCSLGLYNFMSNFLVELFFLSFF